MRKSLTLNFFLILLLSIALANADNGDCSIQVIEDAGLHLYYYQLKNLTMTDDDEIYMKRCMDQLNSADQIMCYVDRCVQPKGKEFLKRTVRAAQYEVLHLCHPHADPQEKKDFKEMADCHNSIWPQLYGCAMDYAWHMAEIAQKSEFDRVRYCCALHEGASCITTAGRGCSEKFHDHFEEIAHDYLGDAAEYMCAGNPYHKDPEHCKELTPAARTGDTPPLIFDSLVAIANAL